MEIALLIVLVCAAADLIVCAALLALVWVVHRRVRRDAAAAGETIPSAGGQIGCLLVAALLGLAMLFATAWFLLSESE